MKVLFVSSGNSKDFDIIPFIRAQGESLIKNGVDIKYFTINEKGIWGYIRSIWPLRKMILNGDFDLIHAHYVLCGWISIFSFSGKPLVLSFMGSDTYGDVNEKGRRLFSSYVHIISALLIQPFINKIIVKSKNLGKYIYFKKKCSIIPNGVDFDIFKPKPQSFCREKVSIANENKFILFLGDKYNPRKNFKLLQESFDLLNHENTQLLVPYPIKHNQIPTYINACDVVVLCSYLEGSPNVVKEAMACNIPVVATKSGDVEEVISDTEGCYVAEYDPTDFANKLNNALNFKKPTKGRENIQHLEINNVAVKIIDIYQSAMKIN